MYTNGIKIWDKTHNIMPTLTGTFLNGNTSTTQTAIVKQPEKDSIYFVFVLDRQVGNFGFNYSVVDMSLNNGKGDLISYNNFLIDSVCEKVAIIQHANGVDYWVVIRQFNSTNFLSYLFDKNGINTPPIISSVGINLHINYGNSTSIGQLKANKKGNKLASANWYRNNVEVFDFDNNSGILSNPINITGFQETRPYGVEFSPNGKILYITDVIGAVSASIDSGKIYQYNLALGNELAILNSKTIINEDSFVIGALQIGPNNKIYAAKLESNYLGIINNPDFLGLLCNYSSNGIFLDGKLSQEGLPNFPNNIYNYSFTTENYCLSDTIKLKHKGNFIDSIFWYINQTELFKTYNENLDTVYKFTSHGTHQISMVTFSGSFIDTVTSNIEIIKPLLNLGNDTSLCRNDSLILDVGVYSNYLWSDSSINPTNIVFYDSLNQDTFTIVSLLITDSLGCKNSDEILIEFITCDSNQTSIKELDNNQFSIYPNPTNKNLNLISKGKNNSIDIVEIYNVNGALIISKDYSNNNFSSLTHKIDIENFIKGIYFLKVKTQSYTEIIKFIVN